MSSQPGGFRSRSKSAQRTASEAHRTGGRDRRRGEKPRPQRSVPVPSRVDAPRRVAYAVVGAVRAQDAYANLVLPAALKEHRVRGRDAAFATEITYGTLRTQGVLDAVIAACSSRQLEAIAPEVLDALRLGAYQVLYTRVEPHAAVDTSVQLVVEAGQERAKGFANAVLRTMTRTPASEWITRLSPRGELEGAAFRHAHPAWIARSFAAALGAHAEELEAALAADSQRPKVHLVARPGEMSAEELALVIGGEQGRYSPYAVYLDSGAPAQLEPVRSGLAAVQDEGSQLIARAAAQAPVTGRDEGRWLDLCAGPGGKAALLGALARIEAAHVDAVEPAKHRADLVRSAVHGLPVTVHTADGRAPGLAPGYDRVLVDAPCSGLGALRRRPEARWRKRESDIAGLAALQYELLRSALALARPGGVVVYSTCSPDLRETRAIVDKAIADLDAVELDAHGLVPGMADVGNHPSVQMWPHRHGTDAMFFAVLRKAEGIRRGLPTD
ncbi:MFS transporter [Corynebacterium sp. zg-331]|uniref:RsmB/NOP family class I SAM-dependent RNA methyltransferase n=1 Tax=unclassified Corynebacterium TaxID=2624378 RepID=UPI0013FF3754|nr:MFS transporter [Corynebacterium sp. zg-331]MPV51985.1 MFS transporter [Corynebacterium sp. zg331]